MKKLVVVLMVLAVASLAQASFFLTIDGQDVTEATVVVGQTVTVGVNSTDTALPPEPSGSTQYGLNYAFTVASLTPSWAMSDGVFTNFAAQAAAGSSTNGWTNAIGSYYDNVASAGWTTLTPTPTAGLWFTFTYTGGIAEDSDIRLLDGNWGSYYDEVRIHNVVPEPATMTLLGLGLVALFRKK